MRIRTIKPEFYKHEDLYELEKETGLPVRIAFSGLWCAADKAGRFKWRPRQLGVEILPYDNVDFSRVLDALATRGFVVKYASGTAEFGWIPGFERHQVINNKERPSELPDPATCKASNACPTRAPRDADLEKGKGREGNMERNGKEDSAAAPKPSHKEFIELWEVAYESAHRRPYKVTGGKDGSAVKALLSGSKRTPLELMVIAKRAWANRSGFFCKRATSIAGFNSAFNEICDELAELNGELFQDSPDPNYNRWAEDHLAPAERTNS